MRPIVTDRVTWSVGRSVTVVSPATTAEVRIDRDAVWDLDLRAHWRHLANTVEPSMCGGDAACCHITLTTCFVEATVKDDQSVTTGRAPTAAPRKSGHWRHVNSGMNALNRRQNRSRRRLSRPRLFLFHVSASM